MTIETCELAPDYVISRVAKGNWQLAAKHSQPYEQAQAIEDMRRFVEAGINAFDCADHYVGVEDLIGAFRRKYPSLGAQLRVSTKYTPDLALLSTLTKAQVEKAVDTSIARLGVEQLDLVQFHWWDYAVPGCVQAMQWLQELRQAGKIRHLGTTNFDVPHLREILDAGVELLTNQLQYSALDHRPENGMIDLCREHDVKLLLYGTVAGGFLSNRYLGQPDPPSPLANRSLVKYRLIIEDFGGWDLYQELLRALDRVARKHGSNIAAVAVRYALDKPQVACALVGAKDASHLDDTLAVFSLTLDDEDRALLQSVISRAKGPLGDCYEAERIEDGPHKGIMHMNQNTRGAPAVIDMNVPLAAHASRKSP